MTGTKTRLYFWGGILSNWATIPGGIKITKNNLIFSTSEQLFMWFKAKHFNDLSTMILIERSQTPKEAKKLGRRVKGFSEEKWEKVREGYMLEALKQKALVYPEFKDIVMKETREFVEASPYDRIWGIGVEEEEAARKDDPKTWNGLNLLGKCLGELRIWLKENEN